MTGDAQTIQYATKACVVYCLASPDDQASIDLGDIVRDGGCGVCIYRGMKDRCGGVEAFFHGVRHEDATGTMQLGHAPHVCLVHAPSYSEDVTRVCRESVRSVVEVMDGDAGACVERMMHAWCEENVSVVYLVTQGTKLIDTILKQLDASLPEFSSNVFTCVVVERPGYSVENLMRNECAEAGVLRPPQSFMFLEGVSIESEIDQTMVGTFVYRLPGSTRVDHVKSLSDVEHVYQSGAHTCIAVERILYEVAYKIGYSLKYGA